MVNGKNVTSKVKNEKKGIRCFNALLKIESYMLDQNLREFKQRAEKDYYSEYFIYDRTREDCLTFRAIRSRRCVFWKTALIILKNVLLQP